MAIKHTIRTKDGGTQEVELTLNKAVKLKCYECSGWNRHEVKHCTVVLCELWPFRLGNRTGKKREITEEHKNVLRERLKTARSIKNPT